MTLNIYIYQRILYTFIRAPKIITIRQISLFLLLIVTFGIKVAQWLNYVIARGFYFLLIGMIVICFTISLLHDKVGFIFCLNVFVILYFGCMAY